MNVGAVFFVGLGGVAAYVGYSVTNYDPSVFKMSAAQAQTALASKVLHLPRKDGDGTIELKGIASEGSVTEMSLQYADWAPIISCVARVTEVSKAEVKVKADCSGQSAGASAMQDTVGEFHNAMFDEFIQSTLAQRPFNRKTVDSKEMAIVMKNLGGMQREALRTSDEMQALEAQSKYNQSK
jgi:hypothetical protein